MNDDQLKQNLKDAFAAAEGKLPSFESAWTAAKARRRGWSHAMPGIAVAAAIAVAAVALWTAPNDEAADEYMIAEALMNSTSWTAPSDSLMPEYRFDIYREIPLPGASTESLEGTLL